MVNCQHAASGCNYPESECSGACLSGSTQRQPAAPEYLTIVYQIHSIGQRKALLNAAEWVASSHGHAIHARNALQAELIDTQAQRLAALRAIEKLNDELGKVSEQRDDLLAVARGFVHKLATYVSVYPGDKQLRRLLDECDAAIAKAGGAT